MGPDARVVDYLRIFEVGRGFGRSKGGQLKDIETKWELPYCAPHVNQEKHAVIILPASKFLIVVD